MGRGFAFLLVHLALGALVAFSLSSLPGERALAEIELERSSGTALALGVSADEFCLDETAGHGDCPLCRLEAGATIPTPILCDGRDMATGIAVPLPRDLALCKRARDATVQARAPPLA